MVLEVLEKLTQEYLAPEMVSNKPYGKASDWWSLGILMFHLLTDYPSDKEKLFNQILHVPIEFPLGSCIIDEAKDFVYRLLERDPTKRLSSHGGVREVKPHTFFGDVN